MMLKQLPLLFAAVLLLAFCSYHQAIGAPAAAADNKATSTAAPTTAAGTAGGNSSNSEDNEEDSSFAQILSQYPELKESSLAFEELAKENKTDGLKDLVSANDSFQEEADKAKEWAKKQGGDVQKNVQKLIEGKQKFLEAFKTKSGEQLKKLSKEAQEAGKKIADILCNKSKDNQEKKTEVNQIVDKLPQNVKEELKLQKKDDLETLVQASADLF